MNIEEAILSSNLEQVKEILCDEPNLIDEKDKNGILMSFLAAKTGDFSVCKYIVEYSRASMNIKDDLNRNILHYAAMSGNVQLNKYFVERVGMDPLSGDFNLVTPLDIAYENNFQDLINYFEEHVGAKRDEMYRNPIRTGMHPDPSIVRVGEDYYMVNSSFVYFPCIPVSHSKDLIHWRVIGHAITEPEWAALDEIEGGRGYWAPDISYNKGRFYITATYRMNDYTNVYRKQIVVSSEKPEGPYTKPAIIDEDGIDPSIFTDDDGRRYMLLNRGARIFEISEDGTRQISEAELLFYGDNKRAPEGPHLLKKDGYYYLFEAEGGTGPGHRITVSRSKTLKGIYEPCPYNPIMRQNDENAGIQRCGHGKPVCTQNGEWYMVYLCGRQIGAGYSMLGRETALDKITWTADGWPIVNNLKGPSVLAKKPNLPECIWESSEEDDFDKEKLSSDWVFIRSVIDGGVTLKDSHLVIKGSEHDLNTMKARNLVLRRQKDFVFRCDTVCSIDAGSVGDAGITCYYDENTYLKFGIYTDGEKSAIKLSEHIGSEDINHESSVDCTGMQKVYLRVETDYLKREFYYSFDGTFYIHHTTLENVYYLCDEGLKCGKRFTGAMAGMYAYGAGLTARFDFFNIKAGE